MASSAVKIRVFFVFDIRRIWEIRPEKRDQQDTFLNLLIYGHAGMSDFIRKIKRNSN